jgi:hypothetical protein
MISLLESANFGYLWLSNCCLNRHTRLGYIKQFSDSQRFVHLYIGDCSGILYFAINVLNYADDVSRHLSMLCKQHVVLYDYCRWYSYEQKLFYSSKTAWLSRPSSYAKLGLRLTVLTGNPQRKYRLPHYKQYK